MRVTVSVRRKAKLPRIEGRETSLVVLLKEHEPRLVIEDVTDRRVSVEATEAQVRSLQARFAGTLAISQEVAVRSF